ncbi:type II CRISPR-associated endonuclease Cas1 [Wenyingzhuangia sp. 2_MG-2023]|uniref:type II CRISPR-associated endonuclease Cas1 n=1 Tax=Wenyingzhuangia sp. 2_MG-2023 TaxID=3062639 RepID=UPI0026E18B97|nr:type II CRISPR-associated endonuclease Cas1 [Wenyingzhuangia sp. 2_MG-2023]MDO6739221.1 type II CRISPR-associated endonuclease Cas1 [Wenyingzhuangia sp. 2_MG-2023]
MIKRTIYIGNPAHLKLKHQQLLVQEPLGEVKGSVPIEDIALLILDHYQITISTQVINSLQGNGVCIVTCDAHHLPFGITLPLYGHSEHSERVKYQLDVSEPLKKQLWKQTIQQKIKNQEALLKLNNRVHEPMEEYRTATKSGDTTNTEGKAAQYYWKHLFPEFQRNRFGDAPNTLLNFGYAILRSIVARALVSSGLLPVLGLFHKNKYNPYCLADDIMEPYRPFVDKMVVNHVNNYGDTDELTKEVKAYLLGIATQDVWIDGQQRPLLVAVTTTTASLYKCYTGELRTIKYPELD